LDLPTQTSYDEVPYDFRSFTVTHPDHLATMATLFGLKPQSPAHCRVLELGSARGGNLIPMAINLPNSQFLGIDLSTRQVRDGNAIIEKLGLKNIELRHANILEVDESYGTFDYIISHGVYSWVPVEVQNKILSICSKNLKPMGIAYVSYNVYPGWHMFGMIRDMMLYHSGRFSKTADRIAQSRALLAFLSQSVPPQLTSYSAMLKESLDYLQKQSDNYLFHDHLEEYNEPVYFYQFIERAASAKLDFLCESNLAEMTLVRFSPEAQKTLRKISLDITHMEQYMDFLNRRTFRRSLLCHQDVPINRNIDPACIRPMLVTANCKPVSATPNYTTEGPEQFQSAGGSITLTDPYVKTALAMLIEALPMPIPFEDLAVSARKRLSVRDGGSFSKENDYQTLGNAIVQCFIHGFVKLQLTASVFTPTLSEKPVAYPLARLMAETSTTVTNARHEMVTLNDFDQHVLRTLDGSHDRNSILQSLMDLMTQGKLIARENNQTIQDRDRRRAIIERELPGTLKRLCEHALIVSYKGCGVKA
jgi:methyltransferase-like protein/2-polyprenyl-3-methyl-5-hydroxy-6-metoxy-1,4-benzoquinol methylase